METTQKVSNWRTLKCYFSLQMMSDGNYGIEEETGTKS